MTSSTVFVHDHVTIIVKVTGEGYCDWLWHFNKWLHFFTCFNFERKD